MNRRRAHPSPLGELTLVADEHGLVAVLWPDDERARVDPDPVANHAVEAVIDRAAAQLDEYFAGARTEFDLPLAPRGTPFQREAWDVLRTIPYGTTISYGEQARALGDPKRARAVGAANGRNPLSIVVPCHRVRGADGRLTGFAGGLDAKAWLLDHEQRVLVTRGAR
ncbi:MAG: methylated-DNA--[protein]-cysteine S-methyltransferase [Ilumatobacteraceae bacterium]